MKEIVMKEFNDSKDKYELLIKELSCQITNEKWAQGIVSAYSLTPYYSEILGNKPGKFLKSKPELGKNKQCYFINDQEKIIGEIQCLQFSEYNKKWIIARKFYKYTNNNVIEYKFGSCLETELNANLVSVSIAEIFDNKVNKIYSINKSDEYSELNYGYEEVKIKYINQKMWIPYFVERNYEINYYTSDIEIFEKKSSGEQIKIYPDK